MYGQKLGYGFVDICSKIITNRNNKKLCDKGPKYK